LPAGRVAYYQEALGFRLAAGAVSRRSIVRRRTDVGHAGEDGRVAGSTHGFELLGRGGHGGLDRGDLAQPTLLLGLRKPVDEVYTRAAIRARCANCSACPWRSSCRCGPVPACGSTVTLTADVWTERVLLAGAEPVRRYLDGPAAGEPAVTRHRLGRGTAWHISTRLSGSDLDAALADAGLPPLPPPRVPDGVELVRRAGDSASYRIAINHTEHDAELTTSGKELLTGAPCHGVLPLPAGDVRVLRAAS
jgi:hypothetical protein